MASSWDPVEPDIAAALAQFPQPLDALAAGTIPAIVLRGVFPAEECADLVRRFLERGLIYDPATAAIPEKFQGMSVREDGWQHIGEAGFSMFQTAEASSVRRRIDIGTSLGNLGNTPEQFFEHVRETEALFNELFATGPNPIAVLYDHLARLAPGKRAMTAREPDGRLYGPAIFRVHYGGYTYGPHFDSVRYREKRAAYAVARFQHQFAGVMCIQNTERGGETAQGILHQCLWSPEVDPYIVAETFPAYAAEHNVASTRVHLEPGDLYFFNTRLIHEVPGVAGRQPRIVLATFVGYSEDDDEVFVWS